MILADREPTGTGTGAARHARHPVIGRDHLFGGRLAAQAQSNRDAWAQELAVLREHPARS